MSTAIVDNLEFTVSGNNVMFYYDVDTSVIFACNILPNQAINIKVVNPDDYIMLVNLFRRDMSVTEPVVSFRFYSDGYSKAYTLIRVQLPTLKGLVDIYTNVSTSVGSVGTNVGTSVGTSTSTNMQTGTIINDYIANKLNDIHILLNNLNTNGLDGVKKLYEKRLETKNEYDDYVDVDNTTTTVVMKNLLHEHSGNCRCFRPTHK